MQKVRNWGFDYLKLDFLYAGALPGNRQKPMPREEAYRQGMQALRTALGDAYLLTCGAPIIPTLGLCDGLRIGPDVASHWASHRDDVLLGNFAIPGARNAIRTTVNRLWLKPLVHTDPDVVYFASEKNMLTAPQAQMLRDLALVCDFKAISDALSWLHAEERGELERFLNTEKKSPSDADFSAALAIPDANFYEKILGAFLGWLGSIPLLMKALRALDEKKLKKNLEG